MLAVAFFGYMTTASATILYQEDWGTTNGGSAIAYGYSGYPAYPFGQVGWNIIVPAAQTGSGPPYEGIYVAGGANDANTGYLLPVNTVYYTTMSAGQTGCLYTTAGASGGSGDSIFPAGGINPASYPGGLYLNAEVSTEGTSAVNYFAIQLNGGNWYVAATPMSASEPPYPQFVDVCLEYSPTAGAWNNLTISPPNTVTIGSAAGTLSGTITGFGVVQVGPGGWNYNELAITTTCDGLGVGTPAAISFNPLSQSVYAGGGVSFLVQATGTTPITYTWTGPNGVIGPDVPGVIQGSATAQLTLYNVQSSNAGTYAVEVSNDNGANTATSTSATLTLNSVPSDYLYAETVPYIGPTTDIATSTIGWVTASDGQGGIYSSGGGAGAVYAYEPSVETIIYYADMGTDTGQAGLAFPSINPANYPYVTLQTSLDANSVVTDVTAYFAVQMTSGSVSNWYVYGTPIDEDLSTTGVFETQQLQFTTAGSQWKNLTITSTNAVIGSQVSGTLAGNITGAGLVFHFNGGGGDFNWDQFLITTDQVLATAPVISSTGIPWSQTVYSGGGVSYEVTTTSGTVPFTYRWTLNGTTLNNGTLADGAVVSGATTPNLTIAGLTDAEVGGTSGGSVDVVAYISNGQGSDNSDAYYGPGSVTLTVNNPPIGLLYEESFPWINPSTSGEYSVAQDGWTEAFYQSPASLYNNNAGNDGAVSVYSATPITVAYYTDTYLDTNQAGLPFPNIDPAGFVGSLGLQVDLQGGGSSGNVTAYWAVAMTSGGVTNWYASASPIAAPGSGFATVTLAFSPASANWDNLTITPSGEVIVSTATGPLSGAMTGAGLVFVIVGSGGDYNFDNFQINGTGVGNIAYSLSGSSLNLSWVGNPAVQLQSASSVSGPWANVSPSTLGKYSKTVTATGGPKFYRLHGTE